MFELLLPYRLAQIDRCRAGQSECDYRSQLPGHLRHGIGRHSRTAHMSKNRGVRRRSKPPHHLIHHHRQRIPEKIPYQQFVCPHKIAETELNVLIKEPGITEHKYQLDKPGCQRTQRGSLYSHCRTAEEAEDKDRIQYDIADQRDQVYNRCDYHPFHAAHNKKVNLGNSHQDIGKGNNSQILHTLGNDRRIICKYPHQKIRDQQGRHRKYGSDNNGRFHPQSQNLFYSFLISLPPVLCSQHCGAGGQPKQKKHHDILHLSRQGRS